MTPGVLTHLTGLSLRLFVRILRYYFLKKGKGKGTVSTAPAHAMKVYGGMEVYYTDPHSFISALDADEWLFSRPGHLIREENAPTIYCIRGISLPQVSVPRTGYYTDYDISGSLM
jgi:hypothetical protein